jgi:hypothetical protein
MQYRIVTQDLTCNYTIVEILEANVESQNQSSLLRIITT